MTNSFAQLGLPKQLVRALTKRGIIEPFPIQQAAIPDALDRRDISGKAPTGSGKTLAFGLPTLTAVERASSHRPRALVLVPTRELAEQIKQELGPLGHAADRSVYAIYGGVSYGPQRSALRRGVDILVATPGRLEDLMQQRTVDLRDVTITVVDEADRMADMGFLPAVRRILDQTSAKRQTLLFSATLDGDVAVLSRDYQRDPVLHEAAAVEPETIDASHHFWLVQHHDRVQHTADVVGLSGRSIVFARTRHGADRLAKQLGKLGVDAVALHGGRSQNQRKRALAAFSGGNAQALVATDVAARGIHIDDVASVVHFDPPGDHKDYVHRSGRTGRAGATGTVVSLVTGQQRRQVNRMQRALELDVSIGEPRLDDLRITLTPRRERAAAPKMDRSEKRSRANEADRDLREKAPRRPSQRRPTVRHPQSLYVANLPWRMTAQDVAAVFRKYGKVQDAVIITDRRSGRSKGFGFVDMPAAAARDAMRALNGKRLGGRPLTVKLAKPRPRRR